MIRALAIEISAISSSQERPDGFVRVHPKLPA
jgi:hypothetical protein